MDFDETSRGVVQNSLLQMWPGKNEREWKETIIVVVKTIIDRNPGHQQ